MYSPGNSILILFFKFLTRLWRYKIAIRLFYTDIQLKTLRHSLEVFNMKINMRRDYVIFQIENHIISNAKRRCFPI